MSPVPAGPAPRVAKPPGVRSFFRSLAFTSFMASFALDFRGERGGSAAQLAMLAVALLSTLILAIQDKQLAPSPNLKKLSLIWLAFTVSSVVGYVIARFSGDDPVPLELFARLVLPYVLCGLALIVCQSAFRTGASPRAVRNVVLFWALTSMAWTAVYALKLKGIRMEEMRYQLVGPGLSVVFSYAFAQLFFGRRATWMWAVIVMLLLTGLVLSVTRGFALRLAVVVAVTGVALYFRGELTQRKRLRRVLAIYLALPLLGLAALGLGAIARPHVVKDWVYRITLSRRGGRTQDPTAVSRRAQAVGMLREMEAAPLSFLVGKGLGSEFSWDPQALHELQKTDTPVPVRDYSGADGMYPYIFFTSGILFGALWVAFFWGLWALSWRLLRRGAPVEGYMRADSAFPFLYVVMFLTAGLTSNPLGERFPSIVLGCVAALACKWHDDLRSPGAGQPPDLAGR